MAVVALILNMTTITTYMSALRYMHSSPPLTHNENLTKAATSWGVRMANKTIFQHSNYRYGENIALIWMNPSYGLDGTRYVIDAITMWYSEVVKYNYLYPSFGAGHFTQLVWKSSKEYGVSAVYDGKKKVYITMEFDPPGNYLNSYVYNVFPIKGATPSKKIIHII